MERVLKIEGEGHALPVCCHIASATEEKEKNAGAPFVPAALVLFMSKQTGKGASPSLSAWKTHWEDQTLLVLERRIVVIVVGRWERKGKGMSIRRGMWVVVVVVEKSKHKLPFKEISTIYETIHRCN